MVPKNSRGAGGGVAGGGGGKKGKTRAFVAVEVDDHDVLQRLAAVQDAFSGMALRLRPVALENVHLTLKFLGQVDDGLLPGLWRALEGEVNGADPLSSGFDVELGGVGQFKYSVLWVGVGEGREQLAEVQRQVEAVTRRFGFPPENRRFKPHLTIARVKFVPRDLKREWMDRVNALREEPVGRVHVKRVELKKSVLTPAGPVYSTLRFERRDPEEF
ncbi:MAG: RNA 2',3'-cyclic phosphodiesterase [Promethearchaeota archaeon]